MNVLNSADAEAAQAAQAGKAGAETDQSDSDAGVVSSDIEPMAAEGEEVAAELAGPIEVVGDAPLALQPLDTALDQNCASKDELLSSLGLRLDYRADLWLERTDLSHIEPRTKPIGEIWPIQAHALKAVCLRHQKCNLLLNSVGRAQEIERVLLQWLAYGWADTVDASQHAQARDRLRERYKKR